MSDYSSFVARREHTEWFEVNVEAMVYVDESGFNHLTRSRALGGDRVVRIVGGRTDHNSTMKHA